VLAPATELVPDAQLTQLEDVLPPAEEMYLPASQLMHCTEAVLAWKYPAGQLVQEEAAVDEE